MATGKLDLGRQFAILTGQLEDAHAIAIEGQRTGLSNDEAKVLVSQLRCQMKRMISICDRIVSK